MAICRNCWRVISFTGRGGWWHRHNGQTLCIPGFSKNKAEPQ